MALHLPPARARPLQGKQAPIPTREELRRQRIAAEQRFIASNPTIGVRERTRQITIATRYRISESTASALREQVRAVASTTSHAAHGAYDDGVPGANQT